jgi:hypothetical protein
LVEIETLASNYDDRRMQFWQELPRTGALDPTTLEAPPEA